MNPYPLFNIYTAVKSSDPKKVLKYLYTATSRERGHPSEGGRRFFITQGFWVSNLKGSAHAKQKSIKWMEVEKDVFVGDYKL